MQSAPIESISGNDANDNAEIIRSILDGVDSPRRNVVLLNAAATLVAAGRVDHLREGVPLAAKSIDSGAAKKKLEALVAFTQT
jgi:anthranilate phosphoribosyltransferase